MDLFEKTLCSETIFTGRILTVKKDNVQLPNGHRATREYVKTHDAVCIIAKEPHSGDILFVRQFRYPHGAVLLELPAGKIDPGESPLETAKRELEEETGFAAEAFIPLGKYYPTPGFATEVIHLFAAEGLTGTAPNPDDDEFLALEKIPLQKAVDMVLSGEIADGKTQTLLLKYYLLHR